MEFVNIGGHLIDPSAVAAVSKPETINLGGGASVWQWGCYIHLCDGEKLRVLFDLPTNNTLYDAAVKRRESVVLKPLGVSQREN